MDRGAWWAIACVCLVTQSCPILCDHMDCGPPGSSVHGDSPGKNIGVGCHALLQGIFPTHRSSPGLPHYRQIPYHLSQQGRPKILAWVAYPFFRDLPDPGIKPGSPALQADSLPSEQMLRHGTTNLKNSDLMIIESLLKTLRPYSV